MIGQDDQQKLIKNIDCAKHIVAKVKLSEVIGFKMGWATDYIDKLKQGEIVEFRPRGNSMKPRIESGQLCTVKPIEDDVLKAGDIVLCKVAGKQFLHLVKAVQGDRYQIGNNKGHINGWIGNNAIYGKLVKVE